jgi:hypothetical protein
MTPPPKPAPKPFLPQFRTDVEVIMQPTQGYPNGYHSPVNPDYCLTDESAAQLAEILKDLQPKIVPIPPTGNMYGIFSDSTMVPGLQFPDGTVANAGLLARWWKFSNPFVAERSARMEIAVQMEDTARFNAQQQGS